MVWASLTPGLVNSSEAIWLFELLFGNGLGLGLDGGDDELNCFRHIFTAIKSLSVCEGDDTHTGNEQEEPPTIDRAPTFFPVKFQKPEALKISGDRLTRTKTVRGPTAKHRTPNLVKF